MAALRNAVSATVVSLVQAVACCQAASIAIPNGSFESPAILYVGTRIDSWQKTTKPESYDESGGFTWDQLTGVFLNTPPSSSDHIDNCDGNQAIWLFAVPEVGLFQDYGSMDWNDPEPTRAFDATFEPGNAYELTVGVIGGGGGMLEGASLEIALYYRDAQSNVVVVASSSVAHSQALFPNRTHLVDVTVTVPTVKPNDPWAGSHVGVRLLSTVSPALEGGYWDVDNVRLKSLREPEFSRPTISPNGFEFSLLSEPGTKFDLLASDDIALPVVSWPVIRTVTNESGTVSFAEEPVGGRRFYQLRQVP